MRCILHASHFTVTAFRTEDLAFEERKRIYVKRRPCFERHLRKGMIPGSHAQDSWGLQGRVYYTVVSPKESFILVGRWVLVNTRYRRNVSTKRVKILGLLTYINLKFEQSALMSGSS